MKKSLALVGIGAVAAGALGFGVWALVLNLSKSDDYNHGKLIDTSFAEYQMDSRGDFVLDAQGNKQVVVNADGTKREIPGLKIRQYETRMPDGSYKYFLDEKGINYMVKRFFETGNYGPEIFNLKQIWIANVNFTNDHENGMYTPDTGEIGLNARNDAIRLWAASNGNNINIASSSTWDIQYRDWFLKMYSNGQSNDFVSFENQNVRGELVLQTLLHEYGHHLSHSYFSSPFGTSKTPTKLVDTNYWNTDFLDEFKRYLTYNVDHGKIEGTGFINGDGEKTIGIGEAFNSKELWENANRYIDPRYYADKNSQEYKDYLAQTSSSDRADYAEIDALRKQFTNFFKEYQNAAFYFRGNKKLEGVAKRGEWYLGKLPYLRLPYELSYTYANSTEQLEYLYSQEEVFTRKMLLSSLAIGNSQDEINVFNDLVKSKLRTDLFEEEEKIQTNYLMNTDGSLDSNNNPIYTKNVESNTAPRGAKFLSDDPFATDTVAGELPAQKIMELINQHIGHATGDDISFVFNENHYEVIEKGKMGSKGTPETYRENIKFGGYLDKNYYNCIVALNEDGTASNKISDINIIDFNLGYKTTVFGQQRQSVLGKDKFTYCTTEFKPRSTYEAAKYGLAFATQKVDRSFENVTPIASFRGESERTYGLASNYLENQPSTLRIYNASKGTFTFATPTIIKGIAGGHDRITIGSTDVTVRKGA